MSKGVVVYQSVNCGFANPSGHKPMTYFGKVFRIPKSEHGTVRQLEWEMSPRDLERQVRLGDGTQIGRAEEAAIERLEIYDQDSGDVWVMYRVPYDRGADGSEAGDAH
ncbi:MAG: hypothetical protein ACLFV3_00525 [Phycisphaeraceae bacterium]